MARKAIPNLVKKTLNLREGDFEKVGDLLPDLGSSGGIRAIISKFVDQQYRKANEDNQDE